MRYILYVWSKGVQMQSLDDKSVKIILKYNINRPYFGKFTASGLAGAYAKLKTTAQWDTPVKFSSVPVGHIDGNIICNALWYEMSYNPARFGTVSPFLHNGKNNIFYFCEHGVPNWTPQAGKEILAQVQYELVSYMTRNATPNGQWRDVVPSDKNGNAKIEIHDGHSNDTYKILAHLRNSIAMVARQNVTDFEKKRGPYRPEIASVVQMRHPHGLRSDALAPLNVPGPAPLESVAELARQERLDDQMDNLQITIDNRDSISPDLYDQAVQDMQYIMMQNKEKIR